jgi:hypothetical protein
MKRTHRSITLAVAALALLLSASLLMKSQTRDKFVISAKAGGVNAVTGRVELRPYRGADWSLLSVTDDLKAGDAVKTGFDGRVEMLLNPGSYLRMGQDSEFELTNNSLDNLEVRLIRGTAVIEATGADGTELAINITTQHARMVIVKRGLYRVNVIPNDITELFVRKGRVMLADSHTKVKEGNKVVFSGTTFSVAKIQKSEKTKDELDSWSKDRAELVATANRRIRSRDLNSLFGGDFWSSSFSSRRGGVWLFNPAYRCYTFMPFYFGWGSPYGSSYTSIFGCNYCSSYPRGWGGYFPGSSPTSNPVSRPASGPVSAPGPGAAGPGPGLPSPGPGVAPMENAGGSRARPINN